MFDESQQVDLLDLSIDSIISFFIGVLSTKSFQYLGLQLKNGQKSEKDLEKARFGIDIVTILVEKLEPFLDEEEKKHLRQVLSNLHFTFLHESK
jgi:hypothetical protein